MKSAEEALISFFKQVAEKNSATLTKLKSEQCFDIDKQRWQFTLPDLHAFLQQQQNSFSQIDYISFRKLLYSCPINQTVKSIGGEITISNNSGNVDKSLYELVWN